MKIKLNPAVFGSLIISAVILGGGSAFGAVTTVVNTTNGTTMQVGLMDAEPPLGPERNLFNQNMMAWENAPLHPYTPGYWRSTPTDVILGQDMWRIGDITYSGSRSFYLWNAATNIPTGPSSAYPNELGTMLQAPLVISAPSSVTFYASNVLYQWNSDEFYHAFRTNGQLNILQGTTNIQSWSTTCVGILVTNGSTNIYTSGLMTNVVNQIQYSGVYTGFICSDVSDVAYVINYCTGWWPFSISATYTLTDTNGATNCQATATLDSQFHWHVGNTTTNTSPQMSFGNPIALSIEAWEGKHYEIDSVLVDFTTNETYFGMMGDNGMITNDVTTNCQFFRARPNPPQPNGQVTTRRLVNEALSAPPKVVFGQ